MTTPRITVNGRTRLAKFKTTGLQLKTSTVAPAWMEDLHNLTQATPGLLALIALTLVAVVLRVLEKEQVIVQSLSSVILFNFLTYIFVMLFCVIYSSYMDTHKIIFYFMLNRICACVRGLSTGTFDLRNYRPHVHSQVRSKFMRARM